PSTRMRKRRSSRLRTMAWSATSSTSCRNSKRRFEHCFATAKSVRTGPTGRIITCRPAMGRHRRRAPQDAPGSGSMGLASIQNIGVIGAGQMGCGIAHVCALSGYKVHIYDLSKDRTEAGLATINGNLARQVSNGKLSEEDRKAALARISASSDVNDLAPCDMVIEAATEDESIKRKIFAQVCPVLKPEALLATNTSSLSITRLASA